MTYQKKEHPKDNNPAEERECIESAEVREPSPAANRPLVGVFFSALTLVLLYRYFQPVSFVALGLLAAFALAAALRPIADRLWGPIPVRAVVSVLLVTACVAGLLSVLGLVLYNPIRSNLEQLPQLRQRANDGLKNLTTRIGLSTDVTVADLGEIAGKMLTGASVTDWISGVADGLLATFLAIMVVIIAAIYLLVRQPGSLSNAAMQLLPPIRRDPIRLALEQLQPQLRGWAVGTLFSMIVVGTLFGLGFWIVGLEFGLPLALFAGLAQAVPTFGPMVTLLLSLMVAATQGLVQIGGVLGVYVIVQALESYVLTPLVMKQAVRIPPIVTLFSIILWGNIFGFAGLILAIPIDLTLWTFLRNHLIDKRDDRRKPPS